MSLAARRLVTAEELYAMGDIGPCELVRGEIVKLQYGDAVHGRVGARLMVRLGAELMMKKDKGVCYAAGTGFILSRGPDTVRAADFTYLSHDRAGPAGEGYSAVVPDLVVEVVGMSGMASYLAEKVQHWLETGVRSAWVVDPVIETVTVHHGDRTVRQFSAGERVVDDAVLPGFELEVDEIFGRSLDR